MAKFHVNPETGNPGKCSATKGGCPFGGEEQHFTSEEAARSAYEAAQGGAFATNEPKLTLTKADAKKLEFDRRSIRANPDDEIASSIKSFYEELKQSGYTVAEKPATAARIAKFMDELHAKRTEKGEKGLYARLAYEEVASELEKYGVARAPEDAGDKLVAEEFDGELAVISMATIKQYEAREKESKRNIEQFNKPLTDWSDSEIEEFAPALQRSNPYYKISNDSSGHYRQAIRDRRDNLIAVAKREKVLAVWDKLPVEAKELYSKDALQAQIGELKDAKTFPPYYYGFANRANPASQTITVEENLAKGIEANKSSAAAAQRNRESRISYEKLLEKLDNLS